MSSLPDFVVIGSPRSGTTWLYRQLSAHPDVYLPDNKEPRFFAVMGNEVPRFTGPGDNRWQSHMVVERTEYERLFAQAGAACKGEASTDYLYRGSVAARNMRALVPSARIIVILRDPAERAHSAWKLLSHLGLETLSFEEALRRETQRIADGWAWWWHYSEHGFYGRNLTPYFEEFPADQILVLSYRDLLHSPQELLESVTNFIGVSPQMGQNLRRRVNDAPVARNRMSRYVRKSVLGTASAKRLVPTRARRRARRFVDRLTIHDPVLKEETRAQLIAMYRDDLGVLQQLTRRNLDLCS